MAKYKRALLAVERQTQACVPFYPTTQKAQHRARVNALNTFCRNPDTVPLAKQRAPHHSPCTKAYPAKKQWASTYVVYISHIVV